MKNLNLFSCSAYLFLVPLILFSVVGCGVDDVEEAETPPTETSQEEQEEKEETEAPADAEKDAEKTETPKEETSAPVETKKEQPAPVKVPQAPPVPPAPAPKVDASARVIFPNGKQSLQVGKAYKITWESQGVSKLNIRLEENGYPRGNLAKGVMASTGEYSWTPILKQGVRDNHTMKLKVALIDAATGKVLDESDETFIIVNRSY